MTTGEISLQYIGRRLEELQREATHNRLTMDVVLKQINSLYSEFEAQRSRLGLIEHRLDAMETSINRRFDEVNSKLDRLLSREG